MSVLRDPLLGVVLLVGCVGCSASGNPKFVKFTPDSRYLIFEDQAYPRVYVLDLAKRQKSILVGRVACVSDNASQFVLRPNATSKPMPCSLVTLGGEEVLVQKLPPLPVAGRSPKAVIRFQSDDQLGGAVYDSEYASGPASWHDLTIGETEWVPGEIPRVMAGRSAGRWYHPVGIRRTGHVYAPAPDANVFGSQSYGRNVELIYDEQSNLAFRIPSPDGRYAVTVRDYEDPLKRVTLTDTATDERIILLDKNDAAVDVLRMPGNLYMAIGMTLIGADF